ncbi:MAG: type I-E CRISPR-associated protein Cse1/CasA [Hyphomicrobiaceae bacterium]|nr:type I-E CRISPR-associated protein Cse1/CasA [Hyphomicrobiaceae bacterium]
MTFCLIRERWIPVVDTAGRRHDMAPADITEIGDVEFAWGRADLNVATYELLIGLLTVALPVYSRGDWHKRWKSPPTRAELADAFAPLIPWFQLDGDGPRFMQDLQDLAGEDLPPDGLLINAPGANAVRNGTVLFVRDDLHAILSPAAAAIALFALQAFAPTGGAGHRTSLRGGGPLTTLVRLHGAVPGSEAALWRRLWLNTPELSSRDDEKLPPMSSSDSSGRVFPWCRPTPTSERGQAPFEIGAAGAHPAQAMFGMPRRIRLQFAENTDAIACPITGRISPVVLAGFRTQNYGINYGVSWRHPLTPYEQRAGGEVLPTHPKSSRYGYKDWSPRLYGIAFHDAAGAGRSLSENLASIPSRLRNQRVTVSAAGYVMDNMKVLDYLEAQVPWIIMADETRQGMLAALADELVSSADRAVAAARSALSQSFKALGADKPTSLVQTASEAFWITTEQPFRDSLDRFANLADDADADVINAARNAISDSWALMLRRQALAVFDETVPPQTLFSLKPEKQKSIVDARARLLRALSRDTSKPKEAA